MGDDTGRAGADPGRRRRRRLLVAALALLLVPLVAVGGYLGYLNHLVETNVRHADLLPGPDARPLLGQPGDVGAPPGTAGPPVVAGPGPVDSRPVPLTGAGENYLLIGSDARTGEAAGRSDVIVIVHVPKDPRRIQLVHFPRDLYVTIPGHGKNKINAAYAFGGAPLLVRTLQDLLGIRVDHVALVGFEGFKAMTDAVGGVDVNVEEPSSENGYAFAKGMMHLNGDQALAFVRERYQLSQGDISRGRRQQAFIKALMLKGLSRDTLANPAQLAKFSDAASRYLTVDQSLQGSDMRSEALRLRDLRGSDIVFVTAPFSGFGTAPDGGAIDIVDQPRMAQLGNALRTDTMDAYQ